MWHNEPSNLNVEMPDYCRPRLVFSWDSPRSRIYHTSAGLLETCDALVPEFYIRDSKGFYKASIRVLQGLIRVLQGSRYSA